MSADCLPAVPPKPTFTEEPYIYKPPPYDYMRLGRVVHAETRDLTKKYRVIVLPSGGAKDHEWYLKLAGTKTPIHAVERVASEGCGAQFLSVCLTSPNPKKTFDPWDKDFRTGEEHVAIFLEGNGWKAPEEVVQKLLAKLGLDKGAIQERYPVVDEMI